jgi:hypothetical protein
MGIYNRFSRDHTYCQSIVHYVQIQENAPPGMPLETPGIAQIAFT